MLRWKNLVDQSIVCPVERIHELDTLQHESVVKIFRENMSHASAFRGSPQHRVPKLQLMRFHRIKRRYQVVILGSLYG